MAFPESVIAAVWKQSGGKCECTRISCRHHTGRCGVVLTAHNWHAHHKTAVAVGGDDSLSNCEALCIRCHQSTSSYGG